MSASTVRIQLHGGPGDGAVVELSVDLARNLIRRHEGVLRLPHARAPTLHELRPGEEGRLDSLESEPHLYRIDRSSYTSTCRTDERFTAHYIGSPPA